jgi:hypothetical protein
VSYHCPRKVQRFFTARVRQQTLIWFDTIWNMSPKEAVYV